MGGKYIVSDQAHKLRTIVKSANIAAGYRTGDQEKFGPVLEKHSRCIAVASGKGGVGKTNVALALSIAMAKNGQHTVLLDADLGLANVHILLGLAPRYNVNDLVRNNKTIAEITYPGPAGVDFVPGASGLKELANMDKASLERLRRSLEVLDENYDTVVIDIGAGIGHTATEFAAAADTVLLVMTPEPTSLADAYAVIKLLREQNQHSIAIVVNMAYNEAEAKEIHRRLTALTQRFLNKVYPLAAILPFDVDVTRSIKTQNIMMIDRPEKPWCVSINNTARSILGLQLDQKKEGFFQRIFR